MLGGLQNRFYYDELTTATGYQKTHSLTGLYIKVQQMNYRKHRVLWMRFLSKTLW